MEEVNAQTEVLVRPISEYPYGESQSLFDLNPGWQDGIVNSLTNLDWVWRIGQQLPFIPLEPLPLSIDDAMRIVNKYLVNVKNPDLVVDAVFIFENNTVARVIEKSTGMGAFEILIDPWTLMVYPVPGPTLIWNQKYNLSPGPDGVTLKSQLVRSKMTLTPLQAIRLAQKYLDENLVGSRASQKAYPFYGFYSIEVIQDEMVIGKLDVNGETGEVYPQLNNGALIGSSQ